ncbi:GNAT family N-acetyltransferase [Trinickia dinghuensis]|uniref:GNAT family N-acetyltransferase n=1 Tax=Trinickia dinghuensis TaxID=2291023 RepID=A0A3D8JNX5_9BURK|nr:GNAT family N-acetyltransferase [Trinickia dinghuensis]RDU94727.1 GNAT family N-acetyltransferase [Trinickia dinghuensis]
MQPLALQLPQRYVRHGCDAAEAPLDDVLSELNDCDWDPSTLARRLPCLVRQAASLAPSQRANCLIGLRRSWERHRAELDISAWKSLLELASAWSYWPLVIAVGESLRPTHRLDDALLLYLCEAYYVVGEVDAAIDLAVAMQIACPARQGHAATYRHLVAWRDWRRCTLPMTGIVSDEDALYLEPLGHHHVSDFRWQYYDPAIAQLCCLPDFKTTDDWHAWLDDAHSRDDHRFAIMHRSWGFIGSVGLTLHGDVGFFYYWLGRDFQGYGFGPDAATQLLAAAHRHAGMRCCYAKVYDYNTPSRKALEKMGFLDTGIRAAAPNNDQMFYRLGPGEAMAHITTELHALLQYMNSDVQAAVPLTNLSL